MTRIHSFDRRRFLRWLGQASAVAGLATWDPISRPAVAGDVDPERTGTFLRAVRAGSHDTVVRLLESNPSLAGATDAAGRRALVLAHLHDHPTIAQAIRTVMDATEVDLDLVEAILEGEYDLAKELAASLGDDIRAWHPVGGSAYWAAARFGRSREMWPLNRWGANPNDALRGGFTPLRAAFENPNSDAIEDAAMRMIVDAGDVNAPQPDGSSVLHAAAQLGNLALLRVILRRNGDPDARDENGDRPVDLARRAGHSEAVTLLENHASVPRETRASRFARTRSLARYAKHEVDVPQLATNRFAEKCHFDFAAAEKVIAEHPKVIHANSTWNELGVEACAHMGRAEWTLDLLDRGAPMSLATALAAGLADEARRILEEDPSAIRERGAHDFALMWYPEIAGGRVDLAEILVNAGGDLDEEKLGVTLLHRAAYRGQEDLVAFAIERGANVNAVGQSDFLPLEGTPLTFAEAGEQTGTATLLRQAGATL